MSLPEGSPASPSAPPGSSSLRTTSAGSGLSSDGLLAYYDPEQSCWRMCQGSLLEGWETSLGTWPRSGTTRSGIAYQRPPSAPLTDENAFGSWPTPTTRDWKDEGPNVNYEAVSKRSGLAGRVRFPTPKKTDGERGGRGDLIQVVRGNTSPSGRFPTPTAADGTGGPGTSPRRQGGENLRTTIGGQLNPTWVEWLMGFPLGWTDLGR